MVDVGAAYNLRVSAPKLTDNINSDRVMNWAKNVLLGEALAAKKGSITTLCDVGCGAGPQAGLFIRHVKQGSIKRVVCVDLSAEAMVEYKRRVTESSADASFTFVRTNFASPLMPTMLGVQPGSVDIVHAGLSLHYACASIHTAESTLKNLCGMLRVGGYLLLCMPNAAEVWTHLRVQVRAMHRRLGFRV